MRQIILKYFIYASLLLDLNKDLAADVRAIESAYEEVIGKNAEHLPVIVDDQTLSELVLDLHFYLLFAVNKPRAVN